MNILETSEKLAAHLQSFIEDFEVKASPLAADAPNGAYQSLEAPGVILIWLDSIPLYEEKGRNLENDIPATGNHFKKHARFVISVGYRSLEDKPDLDHTIQIIEEQLTYLQIGGIAPLRPLSIGKLTTDGEMHWRQILFEGIEKATYPIKKI